MVLSKRMECVASMVTPGSRLADVGCDHGYLPIWLCEAGRISEAVAMDINPGPLDRARENIAQHGLGQYIQTRLSDGMRKLVPGEVDSAILAGMGGKLIVRILAGSPEIVKSLQELILEPQSEAAEVRKYLAGAGFQIAAEDMVLEDGKFYPVIRAVPEGAEKGSVRESLTEEQLRYGPRLLGSRHPVLLAYLRRAEENGLKLAESLRKAGSPRAEARLRELQEEMRHIHAAYVYYDM